MMPGGVPEGRIVPRGGFENDSVMECIVKGLLLFSCSNVKIRNF
jgi:hypothetical protein